MDIIFLKVIVLLVLFVTTIVFGSLPLLCFTGQGRTHQAPIRARIFSVLNCFAGGVFFSLCLLDLIPDVTESFKTALAEKGVDVKDFPVAETSVAVGFLLILIIEQSFLLLSQRLNDDAAQEQIEEPEQEKVILSSSSPGQDPGRLGTSEEEDINDRNQEGANNNRRQTTASSGYHGHHDVTFTESNERVEDDQLQKPHSSPILRSLLFLGAISFHSILEGIAIGITKHKRDVYTLWIGISIHKSVIAFSICINLLLTMKKWKTFLCLLIFAAMSPIGIIWGFYLASLKDAMLGSILQGLATGTFLYITFFELLPHEIEAPNDKIKKILAILIGFGIIFGLIAFDNFYLAP